MASQDDLIFSTLQRSQSQERFVWSVRSMRWGQCQWFGQTTVDIPVAHFGVPVSYSLPCIGNKQFWQTGPCCGEIKRRANKVDRHPSNAVVTETLSDISSQAALPNMRTSHHSTCSSRLLRSFFGLREELHPGKLVDGVCHLPRALCGATRHITDWKQ
jgi:hypothetical protein